MTDKAQKRATEDILGENHELMATVFNMYLKWWITNKPTTEEGMLLPPSGSIVAGCLRFLQQNNITCLPKDNNQLEQLLATMSLPFDTLQKEVENEQYTS